MADKIYFLTKHDEPERALVGPDGFDLRAGHEAFQKATGLWYPSFALPEGLGYDHKLWEAWRDGYYRFREAHQAELERYNEDFARWLCEYHHFLELPFELD